jgi:small multidrug resistance pump
MKPLFGYLFLALGISCGIASNSFAKVSEGFSKLYPSILCIAFMMVTMFCIAKAMHALPLLKYNQVPNIYGLIGIILIIIGVVMVNYLGRLN